MLKLKAWSECPTTSDGRGPQWPHTEAVQCHWHSDWHSDCPWSKLPSAETTGGRGYSQYPRI